MKLFDFKFLILLGLALVIYFIYKELEYHRERLTYCEEKIKEIIDNKLNIINNEVIKEISLDENNSISYISSDKNIQIHVKDTPSCVENKNLSISLPIKTLVEQQVKASIEIDETYTSSSNTEDSYLSSPSENINLKISNNSDSIKESESKHLEIYSNDNDNNIETSISDSLMISKNIQNVNNHSETSNSQQSKSSSTKSVKSTREKESLVNNFLIKSLPKTLENVIDDNKLLEINSSQELENVIDALKNELDNTDSEQKTATSKNGSNILSKMKLPELQALAKKENLCLDKKVNGHQKKKTKQELIEELSKI